MALALWKQHAGTNFSPAEYEEYNPIVIAPGLLCGAEVPSADHYSIVTRSPVTGSIICATSNTNFGLTLKLAGLDALVCIGRCKTLSIIQLSKINADFSSADRLSNSPISLSKRLLNTQSEDGLLIIGPAGEQRIPFASLICEGESIGRGGLGAVFGYKNIKALQVYANDRKQQATANGDMVRKLQVAYYKACEKSAFVKDTQQFGDAELIKHAIKDGWAPIKNFSLRTDPRLIHLSGKEQTRRFGRQLHSCRNCMFQCRHAATGPGGQALLLPTCTEALMLGSNLGCFDPKKVAIWLNTCIENGLDPISVGAILGWAIVAQKKGILPWLPDITFDDKGVSVRTVIESIAQGRGPGHQLGMGLRKLTETYGGTEFAYMIRNLEIGPVDYRGAWGQGLCDALGNGFMFVPETLLPRLKGASVRGKASWVYASENLFFAMDTIGYAYKQTIPTLFEGVLGNALLRFKPIAQVVMRLFPSHATKLIAPNFFSRVLSAVFGEPCSAQDVIKLGMRVWELQQEINESLGQTNEDETLPEYFLQNPSSNYPHDDIVPLQILLKEYKKLRSRSK